MYIITLNYTENSNEVFVIILTAFKPISSLNESIPVQWLYCHYKESKLCAGLNVELSLNLRCEIDITDMLDVDRWWPEDIHQLHKPFLQQTVQIEVSPYS